MKPGIYDVWAKDCDMMYIGRDVYPGDGADVPDNQIVEWVAPLEDCPKPPKPPEQNLREQLSILKVEIGCKNQQLETKNEQVGALEAKLGTLVEKTEEYLDAFNHVSRPLSMFQVRDELKALIEQYKKEETK
jgi:hypothetical protein